MPQILIVILGALVSFVLFRASGQFGPVAIVSNLLVPLVPAYVGMRVGPLASVIAVLVATLLALVSMGLSSACLYLLQFGVMAVALVWFLRTTRRWDRAVALALLVMIVATLLGLGGYALLQGKGPIVLAGEIINAEIAQASAFMNSMFADSAATSADARELKLAVEGMADFMRQVYPGMVILVSGLLLLGLTALLKLVGRNRYQIPGPPFAEWKAPEQLVWILIASGFMVALLTGMTRTVALNLLVVLLPVYFVQGLAVIDCFFRRKALSPALRILGYMLVTLVNPLPMFVTGIGVFDLWIDFRKPREQKD